MFSSNKKYKWLTFILKYGEDDYVKSFVEKTALFEKISLIFPIFVQTLIFFSK
jgi:hypothetical protein